jgi:drug/metabolite transporter (DMT)-like permease
LFFLNHRYIVIFLNHRATQRFLCALCGFNLIYPAVYRHGSRDDSPAYVNPLVAVCLGKTLGKENVTLIRIAGLIIILLSVMFINRKKKNRKPTIFPKDSPV